MRNPAKLLTCCALMVAIAAIVAASAQTIAKQEHPYLEEPLSHLVKRIPELKGIRPAADQHELATVLQRVGAKVDDFFTNVVDVIAREDITQQKLVSTVVNGGMPGGVIQSKAQARDNYLIVRRPGDARADINEYRMDDSGQRLDEVGLQKGFFMTSGFALSSVHFSSLLQWESRFVLLGDQKIAGQNTYVVAFAQLPGEAHTKVTMEGAGGVKARFLMQGIAWVDKANFQIVQIPAGTAATNWPACADHKNHLQRSALFRCRRPAVAPSRRKRIH